MNTEQACRPLPAVRPTDRLGRDPRSDDLGRDLTGSDSRKPAGPGATSTKKERAVNRKMSLLAVATARATRCVVMP